MTDEFERIWKEVVMAQSRYYPSISQERLRKMGKETSMRITSVPD
jgi:hypothetical protein